MLSSEPLGRLSQDMIDMQCFEHENGDDYLFVANLDVVNEATAKVTLKKDKLGDLKTVRNVLTKEKIALKVDEQSQMLVEIILPAGHCVLLKLN